MARHVLRNCVGAALSMTGLQVGLMFSGVLVVEQVFGWPGIGQYIAQSIPVADFPAIAGVTLMLGALYVFVNTVVDLLQAAADRASRSQEDRCRNGHSSWAIPFWSSSTSRKAAACPPTAASIPVMPGHGDRVARAQRLVAAARHARIPIVFFQEVHRPSGIDFGRELDGVEGGLLRGGAGPAPTSSPTCDRFSTAPTTSSTSSSGYSGFIGTEFEIVLSGLKAGR